MPQMRAERKKCSNPGALDRIAPPVPELEPLRHADVAKVPNTELRKLLAHIWAISLKAVETDTLDIMFEKSI